jgi:hypothetical protein
MLIQTIALSLLISVFLNTSFADELSNQGSVYGDGGPTKDQSQSCDAAQKGARAKLHHDEYLAAFGSCSCHQERSSQGALVWYCSVAGKWKKKDRETPSLLPQPAGVPQFEAFGLTMGSDIETVRALVGALKPMPKSEFMNAYEVTKFPNESAGVDVSNHVINRAVYFNAQQQLVRVWIEYMAPGGSWRRYKDDDSALELFEAIASKLEDKYQLQVTIGGKLPAVSSVDDYDFLCDSQQLSRMKKDHFRQFRDTDPEDAYEYGQRTLKWGLESSNRSEILGALQLCGAVPQPLRRYVDNDKSRMIEVRETIEGSNVFNIEQSTIVAVLATPVGVSWQQAVQSLSKQQTDAF